MQSKAPLSPGSSNRAAFVAARIAGLFAGGLGLYLAYGSITEFIRHIRDSQSFAEVIAAIFFDVFLGLIAFWCLRACYQSWRPKENVPFRSLSAILAISFFDIMSIRLLNNSAAHLPGLTVEVWESLLMFVAVILASAFYLSLAWWFSSVFSSEPDAHHIPEFVILLICVLLWGTSFEFLMEVAPKKPGYEHVPRFPWGLVELVVPFIVTAFVWRTLRRCGSRHGKHRTTQDTA